MTIFSLKREPETLYRFLTGPRERLHSRSLCREGGAEKRPGRMSGAEGIRVRCGLAGNPAIAESPKYYPERSGRSISNMV